MRLERLPPAMAKRLAELECPDFTTTPWVEGKPLPSGGWRSCRRPGWWCAATRCFAAATPITGRSRARRGANDLLCSHISINFDRNGFQEDWNVVFPLDRLNELAAEGTIGSVAATHYSFMGATDPVQMVDGAREVAGKLKADHVDAVLLTSV